MPTDKPILIRMMSKAPDKIACPSCSTLIDVPPQGDNRPVYRVALTCSSCSQQIVLITRG